MTLETILQEPELARVAPALAALIRPAIRLSALSSGADDAPLGASKFGGLPDLLANAPWPIATLHAPVPTEVFTLTHPDLPTLPPDGRIALPFIGQIALADLHPYDELGLLPPAGLLSFFYNPVAYWSDAEGGEVLDNRTGIRYRAYGYDDPANWRVLYQPEAGALARTAPSDGLPLPGRYTPATVSFTGEQTLPAVETCFIGEPDGDGALVLTDDEWSAYAELRGELRADRRIHQLLGHPDTTQPFVMERAYASLRPSFFPDLPAREAIAGDEWQRELGEVRLLLQVDQLGGGPYFGRDGRAFFFIREADLRRGDFAHVWTVAV